MTTATTPVEALEMGIEIIKEKGWTKNTFQNRRTGEFCALGAVRAAARGVRKTDGLIRRSYPSSAVTVEEEAEEFLTMAATSRGADDVVEYNDEVATTRAQILRLFRSAIALAKKAGQ